MINLNLNCKYECDSGKIYLSQLEMFLISTNTSDYEVPTHDIHVQSIYNNLKRGLVVLTHHRNPV